VVCKATRWTAMCRELGLGVEKSFVFMSKRKEGWKAYSNCRLCVAQRRTESAVSWLTTNSTSVWLVEGFPTWIAQISGSWESDGFGGTDDDGICCRVNAEKPIVEVGVTALLRSLLATSPEGEGIFESRVSRGQGGPLSLRN
jgi:hypothetical protein